MKYTDNSLNILTTKTFKGIGRGWIVKNLKGNESVVEIISKINSNSKQDEEVTIEEFEYQKEIITKKIELLSESCDGLVAIGDKNFPNYRGQVKESEQPIYIFYKGDLALLNYDNKNIAVIGLLNPTENIELRQRKIVSQLVKKNITIVSGLALGCDSIAHLESLNGGKTVAILPSPLNNIMPATNRNLAFKIIEENGLLITEYFDDHRSGMELSSRYKERDRLQALFSDAIILAASYSQDSANIWSIHGQKLDSGARLAMKFAKEYNIPRAVMYDEKSDLMNPMFDLNRQLIAERKNITILTQKNLESLINRIISKASNQDTQPNLFD